MIPNGFTPQAETVCPTVIDNLISPSLRQESLMADFDNFNIEKYRKLLRNFILLKKKVFIYLNT
ncbi:MAG: hypothetical protein COT09_01535 [Candidatus Hydromicrobium americanum]|nr:MAG: hypothetical protein COT09_01535 [Candidatus Hydromicrobium americanum]